MQLASVMLILPVKAVENQYKIYEMEFCNETQSINQDD